MKNRKKIVDGHSLRKYRDVHKLSLEELAVKLNVSYRTITRWETNDVNIPRAVIDLLKLK